MKTYIGNYNMQHDQNALYTFMKAAGELCASVALLTSVRYQRGFQGRGRLTIPAAAAAKSLQSCPTLCNPIDGSPPGSPVPGILQARTLEWVAISFSKPLYTFIKIDFIYCHV